MDLVKDLVVISNTRGTHLTLNVLSTLWPTDNGPHSPLIHILDDYSLLNIFSFTRPALLDESKVDNEQFLDGGEWTRERWWYKLVQVCRRWRYIVLESASHLRLSLVCARGTPVADMLAHSPPFPLIIDHLDRNHDITAEDLEGITLALQHRERVRRFRLVKPIPTLQKLVVGLDGEFPILEYLLIEHQQSQGLTHAHDTNLSLPETFRAPRLRHIVLMNFAIHIDSPLVTTMGNLVTLSLCLIPPSAHFHSDALLERLSHLPQLEILGISFNSHHMGGPVDKQLLHTPIMMRVTLPNLRWLAFQGASAYLDALLPRITMPLLERLQVYFSNQLTYSVPHLQHFITAGNLLLKLNTATLSFREDYLYLTVYPHKGARMYTLDVMLGCDWHVASTARVFHQFRAVFSAIEHLTLEHENDFVESEGCDEADHTQWRELLGSFGNVKTLFVDGELVGQLSRALQPGEEESPAELLPELQELSYSVTGGSHDAFTPFIDTRQKAGRPVTLIRQ